MDAKGIGDSSKLSQNTMDAIKVCEHSNFRFRADLVHLPRTLVRFLLVFLCECGKSI